MTVPCAISRYELGSLPFQFLQKRNLTDFSKTLNFNWSESVPENIIMRKLEVRQETLPLVFVKSFGFFAHIFTSCLIWPMRENRNYLQCNVVLVPKIKPTLFHFALFLQGYRYWAGIGVAANCESALTYYRRVSNKGG